ncbi:MAG: hypothetical protein RMM31_05630 [Anaerolineae bacterium]|nr:hypothetical protein [Anaerolineae bacterium]
MPILSYSEAINEALRGEMERDMAHQRGSPGAEVAAEIAELVLDYLDSPIRCMAAKNVLALCAPAVEQFVLPGTQDITEAASAACDE